MAEPTLEAEKKDVAVVESVNIRAVENGFIVNVSGRDENDDWANDEKVFLKKKEAVDYVSGRIGG